MSPQYRYCLKLYAKSPAAYKLIRKILILPSPRTLNTTRNKDFGICGYGFQTKAAEITRDAVAKASKECDRYVVLALDEMTIKEELIYQSSTNAIIGLVDYENEVYTGLSKSSDKMASHILAAYMRGITNKDLDGVIACYPTAGIDSSDLFFLLLDLLVEVQLQTSCIIEGIVFDGLPANRTVMALLGDYNDDQVPYRMKNPIDTKRYIYFIPDPPHLLKTCRNNLFNGKKSLWNMDPIYKEPITEIIREDISRGDLLIYPQLTEAHASPNAWQKMNVRIAAQTLSATMGSVVQSRGYEALGKFLMTIDKWFDYVNTGYQGKKFKESREPFKSVTDPRLNWLSTEFLGYLDSWETNAQNLRLVGEVDRSKMILSDATRNGLRIATKSMVEIVKNTLGSGADFVMTRKVNQDTLEAYFGMQRERGARTNNPTICQFATNMLNLAVLKQPIEAPTSSNVKL